MNAGPGQLRDFTERARKRIVRIVSLAAAVAGMPLIVDGCATALQPVASQAAVLYAEGARQQTAILQISLPAPDVYQGLLRVVSRRGDLFLVNRNDERLLLEIAKDGMNLAAQATSLSHDETLLFLWADTGESGPSGNDLTRTATEEICGELAVDCRVREY